MPRVLVVDDSATIRRIVSRTLTQAGFEVSLARDGREALEIAQREVPELVLVDFVMPHMNGLKFVQAMRAISNLTHIPVVLMSAKADRIGDRFVAQTGALDAICKPFSPEALLTVAEHVLVRANDTEPPPAPSTDNMDRISAPPPFPPELPTETTPLLLGEACADIARQLARLIVGLLPDVDADDLARQIEEHYDAPTLFEEIEQLGALIPGREGEIALRGRLEHVSLGEVMQLITHQRQTGVLEIHKAHSRSGRSVAVCLDDGCVQLALGAIQDQEFRIGRYLLRESLIEREDLERILKNRGPNQGLLGSQLVKLGYISVEELRTVLAHQTSELIYEALRWRRGSFRFVRFASRPEAETANLSLPLASILMEGLRRVDEWRLIEEQVRSFSHIPRRDEEALRTIDLSRLSATERFVLDLVDGASSVHEIINASQMSSFDVCKVLFQMATSRLVRFDD